MRRGSARPTDDYAPCAKNGQNCANDIYAVSLPAVTPSAFITWFQAQEACTNAGKRLPSNAEWQAAVAGTPDPGPDNGKKDCNTDRTLAVALTGSRSRCVSSGGAFDMVGNLSEWVADWVTRSTTCGTWSAGVSATGDSQCLTGAAVRGEPGALVRGGGWFDGATAGPLAVLGVFEPSLSSDHVGFRCVGTAIATAAGPDLVEAVATTNPPAPTKAPGTTFSVTDTVRNIGSAPSASSKTRYYLSLDALKSPDDTLLTGSRAVPALAPGASHSGTVSVTVPSATPLNSYFLLACAEDLNAVAETDEGDNCIASAGAIVTVARPDLAENTVSAPPATKARGTKFPVTDTAQNLGPVGSGPSTTRYYLSLDGTKSADDKVLTGSRAVPGLAARATHSGTITVTIPTATPPNTYFLLACADNANTVVETDETNNCTPSSTTMTVTP